MRPMRHKWGRKVHPILNNALLSEQSIQRLLTPLHMSVELLPLGLFTKDHAEHVLKIVNLVSADSASRGNGMWNVADTVGAVLMDMKARVDEGKSWNCTAVERRTLVENILKMDKYLRTWTNKRLSIAAITVDNINAQAKKEGKVFMDRVELKA